MTVTSWKDDNSGGYCKFFKWIDAPVCERAKQIIPGLLRMLNEQKAKNRNLETEVEKLKEKSRFLQSVNCSLEKKIDH
ncbi:hypothetical protein ACS0TY_001466 [Phlomoides rotata]